MEIDEIAVLKQARARSEQDGFTWYLDLAPRGTALKDIRLLSEARRRLYLARARAELRGEAAT